ncbi:MAG: hypothetical protein R2755_32930 [Acidimicrobiales bacterium]
MSAPCPGAGRLAALGDPARLAIVDELSVSDRMPSELQASLALPSNLLAPPPRRAGAGRG